MRHRREERRVKTQTHFLREGALGSKILRAKILRWRDSLIIKDMWKIQKGQLYEFEDLGIGTVLRVSQWVEPKAMDTMVLDGNPVPVQARYTLDVWVEGKVQQLEVHVYFEWTGDVLHRSWNRVGGWLNRKSVKLLAK